MTMNESDAPAGVPARTALPTDRREFLKQAGLGLCLFRVGGIATLLTPAEARAAGAAYQVLTAAEAATLEAWGDTLLPGAAQDGIAHFVDYHLSVPPADCLLLIRYLDIPPPYAPFYRAGLANLDRLARSQHGRDFAALAPAQRDEAVLRIAREDPEGWNGVPAPLFYFVTRSDAVDVVYGTVKGFEKLGIPYMAHILPPSRW
jgi:hypothetical protein